MHKPNLLGHHSIGQHLLNLVNTGARENKQLAARLLGLIDQLKLDPNGTNTKGVEVYPLVELNKKRYPQFSHEIFVAKLIPWDNTDISTQFRLFYIVDDILNENINLFLCFRPYDRPNWADIKQKIFYRYCEYDLSLKYKYYKGETPDWSSQ